MFHKEINEKQEQDFELVKPWLLHEEEKTIVICIPRKLPERYDLKKKDAIALISKEDGILVKRVNVNLS